MPEYRFGQGECVAVRPSLPSLTTGQIAEISHRHEVLAGAHEDDYVSHRRHPECQ